MTEKPTDKPAEKAEKARRVAWKFYYNQVEENKRLREQLEFLRNNRMNFYRLFQLIRYRNTKLMTPELEAELEALATQLRSELIDAHLLSIVKNH